MALNLSESGSSDAQQGPNNGFLSSRELTETPWPVSYILLGPLFLIISYNIIPYLLTKHIFFITPWLYDCITLISSFIAEITLIIFVLFLFRMHKIQINSEKLTAVFALKELKISFLALLLIFLALVPIMLIVTLVLKKILTLESYSVLESPPHSIPLAIIYFLQSFTLGPLVEELFFRGFLYNALKSRLPLIAAILLQAAIFALCHPYSLAKLISVFLVGIALAIVYEKRGNLLAPVFVHGLMNALAAIFAIILFVQNYHVPAATWEEARTTPAWVSATPPREVRRQTDGMRQWQHAINKWGSKGSKQWKKELNAFNAVCYWFPKDREACAKALLGKATIYNYYLRDYRRAINEANVLIVNYPDMKEQVASALELRGSACLMLEDFRNSRASYEKVIWDYKEYQKAYQRSQQGINLLDKLEKK